MKTWIGIGNRFLVVIAVAGATSLILGFGLQLAISGHNAWSAYGTSANRQMAFNRLYEIEKSSGFSWTLAHDYFVRPGIGLLMVAAIGFVIKLQLQPKPKKTPRFVGSKKSVYVINDLVASLDDPDRSPSGGLKISRQ